MSGSSLLVFHPPHIISPGIVLWDLISSAHRCPAIAMGSVYGCPKFISSFSSRAFWKCGLGYGGERGGGARV